MRELTTKIMKSMLRIAVCSIGGVLSIIGILSGSYALVQLPDGASKYMPCVVICLLTLPVGLYLCYLVIKPNLYFIKSRNMTKEERVIENIKTYMKKGKSRIAASAFVLIVTISFLILLVCQEKKLTGSIMYENTRLISLVKLIVFEHFFLGLTGLLGGTLIIEISGLI